MKFSQLFKSLLVLFSAMSLFGFVTIGFAQKQGPCKFVSFKVGKGEPVQIVVKATDQVYTVGPGAATNAQTVNLSRGFQVNLMGKNLGVQCLVVFHEKTKTVSGYGSGKGILNCRSPGLVKFSMSPFSAKTCVFTISTANAKY